MNGRWTTLATATALLTGLIAGVCPSAAGSPVRHLLSLPSPTGPYAVGVHATSVSDPSRIDEQTDRPRRLPTAR